MNGRDFNVSIEGVTPEYGAIRGRGAAPGRYLISSDVESNAAVAVIGQKIAPTLSARRSPIGREILVRGARFQIVGVIRSLGNGQVNDDEMERDNRKIYIPITTLQKQFVGIERGRGHRVQGGGRDAPSPTARPRPRRCSGARTAASPISG